MKTKIKHGLNLKPEERFLFEKLPDALRLESAIENIRQKYSLFWDDICRRVQVEHPKLNCSCSRPTVSGSQVGIGRECWPSEWEPWPSGFYIGNISFEHLCSADADAPSASIWVRPPKAMKVDLESVREPIHRQAERQLRHKLSEEGSRDIDLCYDLPESRDELLSMLTKKGEAQFADCMVSHFEQLAKLIPLIDEVFKIKGKRGR